MQNILTNRWYCFVNKSSILRKFNHLALFSILRNEKINIFCYLNNNNNIKFSTSSSYYAMKFNRSKIKYPKKVVEKSFGELSLPTLIKKYPELETFEEIHIVRFIEFMSSYCFPFETSIEMLLKAPNILENYEFTIPKADLIWKSFGYSTDTIIDLLHKYPDIILLDKFKLGYRFEYLKRYFTKKDTLDAVLYTPEILVEKLSVLNKKLDYLIKEVCHPPSSVANSKSLEYSFKHIKTRHEFLIRGNLFETLNYNKLHKMKEPRHKSDKYYSPHEIICLNDDLFIKKCTNKLLTLNELAAFEEIYEDEFEQQELEKENEDEDEDDLGYDHYNDVKAAATHNQNQSLEFYF